MTIYSFNKVEDLQRPVDSDYNGTAPDQQPNTTILAGQSQAANTTPLPPPSLKTKFKIPSKLIAALLVFGSVGSIVVFLLPRHTLHNSAAPPLSLLLSTGLILIALTGLLLAVAPSLGLTIQRKALIYAFAVNIVIIIVKFILMPLGLYNRNSHSAFLSGSPLTGGSSATPFSVAACAFVLYISFLWFIRQHYQTKFYREVNNNLVPKKTAFRNIVVGLILLPAIYIFVTGVFGVVGYLGEAGNFGVVFGLLAVGFLLAILMFRFSFKQAKETRDIIAITSVYWVMFSIILLYHIMWIIFTGALITIWPFKTLLPTPTK